MRLRLITFVTFVSTLSGCEDLERFARQKTDDAADKMGSALVRPDIDALCELARSRGEDASYQSLMQNWNPSTAQGQNVKQALESVERDKRYPIVKGVLEPQWSCPELEQALIR